jgi:hypothetical protein
MEKVKFRPGTIVKQIKAEGFTKFGMQHHTDLWKGVDGKNPEYRLGVQVEGSWFWYEAWRGRGPLAWHRKRQGLPVAASSRLQRHALAMPAIPRAVLPLIDAPFSSSH